MQLNKGDSVFHRGLGREVEIIGEFSSHYLCKDGKQTVSACKLPNIDLIPPRQLEVIDCEKEGENATININEVTAKTLGNTLKGLGQLAARRLIDRKPDGGYKGIEQLKLLNSDLAINWEAVLPHVTFS